MKAMKIELHTLPNDDENFYGSVTGDVDTVAQAIFAYMTTQPELLKKVFKLILDAVFGGNNNE
jgi:hypothetical protein